MNSKYKKGDIVLYQYPYVERTFVDEIPVHQQKFRERQGVIVETFLNGTWFYRMNDNHMWCNESEISKSLV